MESRRRLETLLATQPPFEVAGRPVKEVITTDGFVTYGDGQDIPALGDDLADLGITVGGVTLPRPPRKA